MTPEQYESIIARLIEENSKLKNIGGTMFAVIDTFLYSVNPNYKLKNLDGDDYVATDWAQVGKKAKDDWIKTLIDAPTILQDEKPLTEKDIEQIRHIVAKKPKRK